jgi:hypothetical protein
MRHLCTLANLRDFAAVAGYDLGVHTALKPLKMGKRRNGGGAIGTAPSGLEADSEERALPGGFGTFSIRQAPSTTSQPRGEPAGQGVVRSAFAPVLHVARTDAGTHGAESGARAHSGPATMWQDSGTDQRSRGDSLESSRHVVNYSGVVVMFAVFRIQTLIVHLLVQRREERGEAAAAAVIRGPTLQDQSIPRPSSGGGPR